MRLPINPWWFLGRLLVFFFLTFLAWKPVAPYYAQLLLQASRVGVWLAEFSTDPVWQHPTVLFISPERSPTAIFFVQRNLFLSGPPPAGGVTPAWLRDQAADFRIPPQGIPAEWVMANLVLLIPLMLATPAPSWRSRIVRLLLALVIALVVQVIDVILAVKVFYASTFNWSPFANRMYQFLDAFVQSWDTQLFPFAIWAGIHFRQLLGGRLNPAPTAPPVEPTSPAPTPTTKAKRRRAQRGR